MNLTYWLSYIYRVVDLGITSKSDAKGVREVDCPEWAEESEELTSCLPESVKGIQRECWEDGTHSGKSDLIYPKSGLLASFVKYRKQLSYMHALCQCKSLSNSCDRREDSGTSAEYVKSTLSTTVPRHNSPHNCKSVVLAVAYALAL